MKIYVHKSKLINQLLKQEDTTKSNTVTIDETFSGNLWTAPKVITTTLTPGKENIDEEFY